MDNKNKKLEELKQKLVELKDKKIQIIINKNYESASLLRDQEKEIIDAIEKIEAENKLD